MIRSMYWMKQIPMNLNHRVTAMCVAVLLLLFFFSLLRFNAIQLNWVQWCDNRWHGRSRLALRSFIACTACGTSTWYQLTLESRNFSRKKFPENDFYWIFFSRTPSYEGGIHFFFSGKSRSGICAEINKINTVNVKRITLKNNLIFFTSREFLSTSPG